MPPERRVLTRAQRSVINRVNQAQRRDFSTNRPFTAEECSAGGAEARYRERLRGTRLNHGRVFGKRDRERER